MKMESLNQRRQDLEKKEAQLKESVLKFDKFLKVLAHAQLAQLLDIQANGWFDIAVASLGKRWKAGKSCQKGRGRTRASEGEAKRDRTATG